MNATFHGAIDELPEPARSFARGFEAKILDVVRVIGRVESGVYDMSFRSRSDDVEDDVKHKLVWIFDLVKRDPGATPNDFGTWYDGTLCKAIAFSNQIDVSKPGKVSRSFWEIKVGLWGDKKNVRVAYGNGDLDLHPWQVADVVELVRQVKTRVALEHDVETAMNVQSLLTPASKAKLDRRKAGGRR